MSLTAAVLLFGQLLQCISAGTRPTVAVAVIQNPSTGRAMGTLMLTQALASDPVTITGTISKLTKGLHGFHIHAYGNLTDGCISAAGHFNPDKVDHAAPWNETRHAGDLGNIEANSSRMAEVHMNDSVISLHGEHSVIGRAFVIHAEEDDLGTGEGGMRNGSLATGNAGKRVACGIIGVAEEVELPSAGVSIVSTTLLIVGGLLFLQ